VETPQPSSSPSEPSAPGGWGQPPSAPPPPTTWEAPPEEVGPAPGYAFGGFGERLLAYLLDGIVNFVAIVVIAILGGLVIGVGAVAGSALLAGTGAIVTIVAIIVVPLVYFPFFWSRGGQTPGMRPFGLRVVRDRDGGPVSASSAILRLIGYWIDGLVFYLGYIWIFIDKRKRGWHDLIAGTVVVKKL
jgi:uncharacterized RDD family membrane protein YckC